MFFPFSLFFSLSRLQAFKIILAGRQVVLRTMGRTQPRPALITFVCVYNNIPKCFVWNCQFCTLTFLRRAVLDQLLARNLFRLANAWLRRATVKLAPDRNRQCQRTQRRGRPPAPDYRCKPTDRPTARSCQRIQ